MSGEISTLSHLFDVMSTDQGDTTETTGENGVTSESSHRDAMYFGMLVVVIGVIGTAANGLVLYALVASKQHKKHELIVNQNAIDLYTCLFLVIIYGFKLSNIYLSRSLGYWLCMIIYSESLLYVGIYASWVNLMIISIDRYLKVVHSTWSKKRLRKWMTYSAIACTWISGFINLMPTVFQSSAVIDGVCYGFVVWQHLEARLAVGIYYFLFTYVLALAIFIFCYGKILMVIRRQARVMASHSAGGPSNAQAQVNHQIQSNVIKTMILVCGFYAFAMLPEKIFTFLLSLGVNITYMNNAYYYATLFLAFLYICANPFIYATKFNPVRRILKGLILCKKADEPVDSGLQMN